MEIVHLKEIQEACDLISFNLEEYSNILSKEETKKLLELTRKWSLFFEEHKEEVFKSILEELDKNKNGKNNIS